MDGSLMDEDSFAPVVPRMVPHGTPALQAKAALALQDFWCVVPGACPQERLGPLHPERKDVAPGLCPSQKGYLDYSQQTPECTGTHRREESLLQSVVLPLGRMQYVSNRKGLSPLISVDTEEMAWQPHPSSFVVFTQANAY